MKCFPCKFRWQRDYHTCMPGCPKTCDMPFGLPCNKPCTAGCDCPPGYVVSPKFPSMCTPISNCRPQCPANSSFMWCVSSCLPKCGQVPPKACGIKCDGVGSCVCNEGYAELERNGKKTCVLPKMCPLLSFNQTISTIEEKRPTEMPNTSEKVSKQSFAASSPVFQQNISASIGSSIQDAQPSATRGSGHPPVTVGTEGEHLPATSGLGGTLAFSVTEARGSKLMSINATTTRSGPSSGTADTPSAGGLTVTLHTGRTLPPTTSGMGSNMASRVEEAGGSKLMSISATGTLSGPSTGVAGTPEVGGLAGNVGTESTLQPGILQTEGSLTPPTSEAGGSKLMSVNATSTYSGPSSGTFGTLGARGLTITAGKRPVPGISGTYGKLTSSVIKTGRSVLVSMNRTSALNRPSSAYAVVPEDMLSATSTAALATASPTPVRYAPRSGLHFFRHTDLGVATITAHASQSYSLTPFYAHLLRTAPRSSSNFLYYSSMPPFYGCENDGLAGFCINPWAAPSPLAARRYVTGPRLYPWRTNLPGGLSYGWRFLGSYSWISSLSHHWAL
nr:Holliday junction resolvase MOC1, chloroplastic-like [Rhipicephalus microplus]